MIGLREALRAGLAPEAGFGDGAANAAAPTVLALAPGLVSRAAWTPPHQQTQP